MRLFGLWLLLSGLVAALSIINPTHYLSVDSRYYLSMAGWLTGLDGDHYGHVNTGWDSTFPIGYPLLIGSLARLTGTSLLVASKGLNSLLIGWFLVRWQRRLGAATARWMGSVLLLGGFLRIVTYTWSEWAFIVVLLDWFWLDSQRSAVPSYRYVFRLLVPTFGLFLLRYVGVYVVISYGVRALIQYARKGWAGARLAVGPDLLYVGLSVGLVVGYFILNYKLTASAYGGERFFVTGETGLDKLTIIGLALLNELLLLRDYIPAEPAALVWLGLLLQAGLLVGLWLICRLPRHPGLIPGGVLNRLYASWLWASGTYLILLFCLRFVSPFSGPNARMLSVVTLPLLMGAAAWVSQWPDPALRRRVARWWVVLLLASGLQLLPQTDMMGKMKRALSGKADEAEPASFQ